METMPRIVEQRYDSGAFERHDSNERHDSARTRSLEQRLDQMEADIKTTHRMLRDLSTLVHRQLQVPLRVALD